MYDIIRITYAESKQVCATKKFVINELGDGFKKIYMERKRFKESVLINTYRHIF